MRKEAGFDVTDRIEIFYNAEGNAKTVLVNLGNEIKSDVLAESLTEVESVTEGFVKELDVNGDKVTLAVKKISK